MGTYSVRYNSSDASRGEMAADWDWLVKNQWARSERSQLGCEWRPEEGLDVEACDAILCHFGLKQWKEGLSLHAVISMSPAVLARLRRQKEMELCLPTKVICSDTIGYHVAADEYDKDGR